MRRLNFPFTAILGQDRMRKALILNLIDAQIGGVLLTGHQGTGKSTAVKSLTDVLPNIEVVENCQFSCDPKGKLENLCDSCKEKLSNGKNKISAIIKPISIIDLPLGVTEDMVCGSLDLEKVLKEGIKNLHPGLLAKANRGLLYVDEVNLLQDHIVDILLDAAASGVNIIEREGVSISHPASFVLVGSMNPEEGELRPQINDRFGLEVTIEAPKDPKVRSEITKRVIEFNDNPKVFLKKYEAKQNELKDKIVNAQKIITDVEIPQKIYDFVSELVTQLDVRSQRADITFIRCSRANAAFRGSKKVEMIDLDQAIDLVFEHRIRALRDDIEPQEIADKIFDIYGKIKEAFEDPNVYQPNRDNESPMKGSNEPQTEFKRQPFDKDKLDGVPESDQHIPDNPDIEKWKRTSSDGLKVVDDFYINKIRVEDLRPVAEKIEKKISNIMSIFNKHRKVTSFGGRGSRTKVTSLQKGRYIAYKQPLGSIKNIAFDASIKRYLIRNFVGHSHLNGYHDEDVAIQTPNQIIDSGLNLHVPLNSQVQMESEINCQINLPIRMEKFDIMEKIFELKAPLSVYYILDASGSMSRYIKQMAEVIRSLHREGYKKKDKASIIVFKGKKATILQRPTTNVSRIVSKLPSIKGTSYTPLASAMMKAENMIKAERMKNKDIIPIVVICSDLGANISLKYPDLKAQTPNDFGIIADELKNMVKHFAHKKIRILALIPRKGKAIRYLGVNPFSIENIMNSFKNYGAEIFEFDGYSPRQTIIRLKKIM